MKIVIVMLLSVTLFAFAQSWQEINVEGFTLRWATVAGDNLAVELNAPTTGWVALGFDPTQAMMNGNIIIGFVESKGVVARDDWGTGLTAHASDISLGGSSDLTVDGGLESLGSTEIQFTIPLNSGDAYDKPLVIGTTYNIILAMGANGADNLDSPHVVATTASITIQSLALEPYTWAAIKKIE